MIGLTEMYSSLRVRILGTIFIIFSLTIGMVLYGVWNYQRDRLIHMAALKSIQMSDMIVAGLRSSMLQNDRTESMGTIRKIIRVAETSRISVLNDSGRIVMTSDPSLEGMVFDKTTYSLCTGCHTPAENPGRTFSYTGGKGEKYIVTATPVKNEPACYGCHDEKKKNIGIFLVETSFAQTTEMLQELARRIVLTGLGFILIGMLLMNSLVTHFFTRPLALLQKGFERVGQGDFSYWVDVKGGGEIGYMADSFNVMSRAIGRLVDEIREKTHEVAAHYAIVDSLSKTIEKKKLKEVVVDLLGSLLRAECVALALAVEKHRHIFEMVKIQKGDNRHYHGYYNTDSGELEMCTLSRHDLLMWREGEIHSPVCPNKGKLLLPLLHKNLALGIISVEKPQGEPFSPAEEKIMPVLAHHIAVALANAQLYEMAITDGLTTLYTKRHFQKKIDDYLASFRTTKRGFCLLMLDLDHFKEVNDAYGHQVGDRVLTEIGGLIRANIRHGDLPFRYGGEEFAVLLQGGDLEEAGDIAERIRAAVEENIFRIESMTPFSKTVSIGLACFPMHGGSGEETIHAADEALYKAKHQGRNRVVVFNAPADRGQAES